MALQLRPRHRFLHNPSLFQFFSTSSDPTAPAPQPDSPDSDIPASQPRSALLFSDVRASLRPQEPSQRMRQHLSGNPTFPSSLSPQQQQRSKLPPMEEIRKGLSEFPARPGAGEQRHSFAPRMSSENVSSDSPANITYSSIFKSLKSNTTLNKPVREDPFSLSGFKKVLKLKPDSATSTRTSLFGKEEYEEGKVKKGAEEAATTRGSMNTSFYKIYSNQELGEKLRNLRAEKKGKDDVGGGFSFLEMNERLAKLRKMEEKEIGLRIGVPYAALKNSLMLTEENKAKNTTARQVDILSSWNPSPDSMKPPQEHLVEKYFHPDNMSSAEKLKIELAKVRDEFKMSESDCGSARVQVAQLTTKIKHLSATLHKKDKHSRKGLEGMVQKRKNLLRYLRRTDWDSYCLVLSKLGLRDNPAYKL